MRFRFSPNQFALLFSISLSSLSVVSAPYEIIDLGTLGGKINFSSALNNINEVVGYSDGTLFTADNVTNETEVVTCLVENEISFQEFCNHAYLYRNDTLIDLGHLGNNVSFALGINDLSTTVGYSFREIDDNDPDTTNPLETVAFVSYDGGAMEALPFPAAADDLPETSQREQRALDISNQGQVVGYSVIQVYVDDTDSAGFTLTKPYIYDLNTSTFTFVPPYTDDQTKGGSLRAINNNGEVVGWGSTDNADRGNPVQALYWTPQDPEFSVSIGTLGGATSQAYDINDNGLIVGISSTSDNYFTNENLAFVYDLSTETMTVLPEFSDLSDYTTSRAYAINNSNQIVGAAQSSISRGNINSAFLYEVGSDSLINLNDMIDCDLGWDLTLARDINEAGYITGTGTLNGEVKSFLLVPTSDTTPTYCFSGPPSDNSGGPGSDSGSSTTSLIWLLLLPVFIMRRYFG